MIAIDIPSLIERPPLLELSQGRALWRADVLGGFGFWVVRYPGLYPEGLFEHFSVSVASLADDPALPPAHKLAPGAEFELAIYALSPDASKSPCTPAEVLVQFAGLSDANVRQFIDLSAYAAVAGNPPPIADLRAGWHEAISHWIASRGGTVWLPEFVRRRVPPPRTLH
jgi:hypothetical protein